MTEHTTRRRFLQSAAGAATLTTASTAASADSGPQAKSGWEWVESPPFYEEVDVHRGPLVDREMLDVIVDTLVDNYADFSRPFDPDDVTGVSIRTEEPIRLYVKADSGVETVHPLGPMNSGVDKIGMWYDGAAGDIVELLADRYDMPRPLVQAYRIHEGAPLEADAFEPYRP